MQQQMTSPAIPDSANLNDIYVYLKSLKIWLDNLHLEGLQSTPMTQARLNQMVANNDLTQSGKLFFNSDTGLLNKTEVVAGTLTLSVVG